MFVLGLSRPGIAKKLKVERAAVTKTLREAELTGLLPKARERMTVLLESLVEDSLLVKLKRPERLSAKETAMLFDRWRLMQGEPTVITEVRREREEQSDTLRKLVELAGGNLKALEGANGNDK